MPANAQLNRPTPCKAWGVTRLDEMPIPDAVTCSYLNARGLKTTPIKRAALGCILRGELHFPAADIACHAEVHADEDSERRDWAQELNPRGRSYFTHHLSVHLSHRLQGTISCTSVQLFGWEGHTTGPDATYTDHIRLPLRTGRQCGQQEAAILQQHPEHVSGAPKHHMLWGF